MTCLPFLLIVPLVLDNGIEGVYDDYLFLAEILYPPYYFYIFGAILFVISFIISFLLIYFKNKAKPLTFKKAKIKEEDEAKEFDLNKYLSFKIKVTKDKNNEYFLIKVSHKRKFLKGLIRITIKDEEDKAILSLDKEIDKKFKKVRIIKKEKFAKLEVSIISAYFKDFIFTHGAETINEYKVKQGISGRLLAFNGSFFSLASYILIFFICLGVSFFVSDSLNVYNRPSSFYEYSFVDLENLNEGIIITKYLSDKKIAYIPLAINGYPVKEIASEAFKDSSVEEVYFSSNLKLNEGAFKEATNLKYVDLKYIDTIPNECFYGTSLESVVIDDHLKEIGDYAFGLIETLKDVWITGPNVRLGAYLFNSSSVSNAIYIPNNTINSERYSLRGINYKACYISGDGVINKDNITNFFSSENYVYFESSCVHDENSYIKSGNDYIHDIDSELIETIPGTCSKEEENHYHCNRCNEEYIEYGPKDYSNHNYVDGICIWCGRKA